MNRGALDFLQTYGDDDLSEDDIVPGPKVSTKRTHRSDSEDEEPGPKYLYRLPVPALFKNNKQQINSNSEENNGRIRSFAHERGNWATYLYIPYISNYGVEELINTIKTEIQHIELHPVDHFHISLTKTVILKYHWIDSFVSTVATKIKGLRRFFIMFDCFQIYCNDEGTRTFIGLQTKTGYDSLLNVSKILDTCLQEYRLETYYKDASFHMSIMWCLGDKTTELKQFLPAMNEIYRKICDNTSDCWHIDVQSIECKTGNKLFTFSFKII
ncbi:U6 snRNA phosphodiesterase 1 [Atheta coriaria]|uniref:U6 snRNA phosphodiesterase 1 n=1 Tax=Dalotia coriaria TaxID=877792 RepID=UPI0031F44881